MICGISANVEYSQYVRNYMIFGFMNWRHKKNAKIKGRFYL